MKYNSVKLLILLLAACALSDAYIHQQHLRYAPIILRHAAQSLITFSNYTWRARSENALASPGPNYYSNSQESVWVDQSSRLHMKIRKQNNKWMSTQVDLLNFLGYGSYIFNFQKGLNSIDPNTILQFFTNLDNKHQIQIDVTQWGDPNYPLNVQYSVQPQSISGNYMRFPMLQTDKPNIHTFTWAQNYILFQSFHANNISQISSQIGKISTSDALEVQWKYKGSSIRTPVNQNVLLCFWLISGKPPTDGKDQQIILKQFKFLPLSK